MIIEEICQEATGAAITVFQGYTLQDLYDKALEAQRIQPMYYI
ncbi:MULTISPECIES: hypothetical protein [Nostoc]|nr:MULTISPECIES: hypothetical protein [Nostoc]